MKQDCNTCRPRTGFRFRYGTIYTLYVYLWFRINFICDNLGCSCKEKQNETQLGSQGFDCTRNAYKRGRGGSRRGARGTRAQGKGRPFALCWTSGHTGAPFSAAQDACSHRMSRPDVYRSRRRVCRILSSGMSFSEAHASCSYILQLHTLKALPSLRIGPPSSSKEGHGKVTTSLERHLARTPSPQRRSWPVPER